MSDPITNVSNGQNKPNREGKEKMETQVQKQGEKINGFAVAEKDGQKVALKRGEFTFEVSLAKEGRHRVVVHHKGEKIAEDTLNLGTRFSRDQLALEATRNGVPSDGLTPPNIAKGNEREFQDRISWLLLQLNEALRKLPIEEKKVSFETNGAESKPQWNAENIHRLRRLIRFAKKPYLLQRIVKLIRRNGVVGEEKTSAVVYLTTTSARSSNPLHIAFKGESASGKSYVTRKTLQFFPQEACLEASMLTPQSLFYEEQKNLHQKCLVITETRGQEFADYPVRLLQSEGKISIRVTIRNPQTGRFKTDEHEVRASIASITTTTQSMLYHDNETRLLSIYTDTSPEQTKRVIRQRFEESSGKTSHLSENVLETLRDFQRILRPCEVIIPKQLADAICTSLEEELGQLLVRNRRDVSQLIALIKASAFLHQYQRRRERMGKRFVVYADLQDYAVSRELIEQFLLGTILSLGPDSMKLLACIEGLPPFAPGGKSSQASFTVRHLMVMTGWSKDKTWTHLTPILSKTTLIETVQESKGRNGHIFRYHGENRNSLEKVRCKLPKVEDVAQRAGISSEKTGKLYRVTPAEHGATVESSNGDRGDSGGVQQKAVSFDNTPF